MFFFGLSEKKKDVETSQPFKLFTFSLSLSFSYPKYRWRMMEKKNGYLTLLNVPYTIENDEGDFSLCPKTSQVMIPDLRGVKWQLKQEISRPWTTKCLRSFKLSMADPWPSRNWTGQKNRLRGWNFCREKGWKSGDNFALKTLFFGSSLFVVL